MSVLDKLADDLDSQMVHRGRWEWSILVALYIAILVSYGAIGRDVFYNGLYNAGGEVSDPISALLPFARVGLTLLCVLMICQSTGISSAFSKVSFWFAPFALLAAASLLWAPEPRYTARSVPGLLALWLAVSMLVRRIGLLVVVRATLHLVAMVVIASAFFAIFIPSIGRHTGSELLQSAHAGRWRGIFVHKNGLGPWAMYGSVFFFTCRRLCNGPALYWWVARLSAVACLIFAGDASAVVITAFLLWLWTGLRVLKRFSFGVSAFFMMSTALLGGVVLAVALNTLFGLLGRDESLTGRTGLWAIAVDMIAQHPWFGTGYVDGTSLDFTTRVTILFQQAISTPDNAYLTLTLNLGIVGCSLFILSYLVAIRRGFKWLKLVDDDNGMAIEFQIMVLCGTLLQGVTDSGSFVCTGIGGIVPFSCLLSLLATPMLRKAVSRSLLRP